MCRMITGIPRFHRSVLFLALFVLIGAGQGGCSFTFFPFPLDTMADESWVEEPDPEPEPEPEPDPDPEPKLPTDTTGPAPVTDLAVADVDSGGTVTLTWTATGDDGRQGTATAYRVRYSEEPLTEENFAGATDCLQAWAPLPPGDTETRTLDCFPPGGTYHIALRVIDDAGNFSLLSNVARAELSGPLPGVVDLGALPGPGPGEVELTWTAPGGGAAGRASSYDVRYSAAVLTEQNFDDADAAGGSPSPAPGGTLETFTVTGLIPGEGYFFALKALFDGEGTSVLSNVAFCSARQDDTTAGIYVDAGNTSGTEDGTSDHPYNTIAEGIQNALPGNAVRVAQGTYNENVVMAEGVHLVGWGPGEKIISTSGTLVRGASNAVLSGFILRGGSTGIHGNGLQSFRIYDNTIEKQNRKGISLSRPDLVVIHSNRVRNVRETGSGYASTAGILLSGATNTLVYGNTVEGVGESLWGTATGIGDSGSTKTRIIGNIVWKVSEGDWDSAYGIRLSGENGEIRYNTVVKISEGAWANAYGICVGGKTNTVQHNIVADIVDTDWDTAYGIYNSGDTGTSFNNVWNVREGGGWAGPVVDYHDPLGTNNLMVDPLFLDAGKGDFRLAADSPCRTAGMDGGEIGFFGRPYIAPPFVP
jgi:hypothetical protein